MPGIELILTPTFQRSLANLRKQEQVVVNQAVMSFWMNPSLPGRRRHPLKLREFRFHSISPNMDLRIVALKDGARHVMMYVDHHDRAYAWAVRRRSKRHSVTGWHRSSKKPKQDKKKLAQALSPLALDQRAKPGQSGGPKKS